MNKGIKNLDPVKKGSIEAKARGKQGGIKSGRAKREKKLISQIFAEAIDKMSATPAGKDSELLKVIRMNLIEGGSPSVQMLKLLHEATEGTKVKFESDMPITININGVDPESKN